MELVHQESFSVKRCGEMTLIVQKYTCMCRGNDDFDALVGRMSSIGIVFNLLSLSCVLVSSKPRHETELIDKETLKAEAIYVILIGGILV